MTSLACRFLFHDNLNDFLPRKTREQWIPYTPAPTASLKDTIETLGIPHVEVMKATVYGVEKPFSYLLQANDAVEVYPYPTKFPADAPKAFVLDVHLGALARLLRMFGIDAVYENNFSDSEIVSIAVAQNRVVLTRDIGLLKHKVLKYGHWLRSQQPEEQAFAVIRLFSLCPLYPFSRCMSCNGRIHAVAKHEISHLLPLKTKEYFDEFYQCCQCMKVYWKGSHYQHMLQVIDRFKSLAC